MGWETERKAKMARLALLDAAEWMRRSRVDKIDYICVKLLIEKLIRDSIE